MYLTLWRSFLLFLFLTSISSSGFAQETPAETTETTAEESTPPVELDKKSSDKGVEKLQVTGSHIKRVDVEGPSPVLTLDREYLDKTGYNSVGDVLRDTSVASIGGLRENALGSGGFTGAATTSIRGMGSDNILVLMNGKRLPNIGGGTSVDLNLIPMSAVERIEILKDGASAIYGSEALGGVINFITKKDYDGGSVMIRQTTPEEAGGQKYDLTATYGQTGSNYSVLGVFQFKMNKPIWSFDRDFAQPRANHMSVFGSPGTYSFDGGATPQADPACTVVSGGFCRFDYSRFSQITPETQQYSALVTSEYEFNESLKMFARGIYVHRFVKNILAPAPDSFTDDSGIGSSDWRIPKGTFDTWGVGTAPPGGQASVFYRLVEEAGQRKGEVTSDSFSVDTGLSGYIGDSWEWELSGAYGQTLTEDVGVSGYANLETLYNLATSSPTGFNPFAASGSKSDVSSAFYKPVTGINSSVGGIEFKTTGELFEMPAGPAAIAMGTSSNWQTFEQTADAITAAKKQWGGGSSSTGRGLRDFQSLYAEVSLPPFTGFELQLAGRFDHYSDFGGTVNPKVAARYKPINSLLFRASWGTGFRAPSLFNLYGDEVIDHPQGTDPVTGQEKQFEFVGGGNANLREEISNSLNVGMVIEPFSRFSISTDYFITRQDSIVSNLSSQTGVRDIFRAEQILGNAALKNQYNIDVVRSTTNGPVDRIIAPNLNLSKREIQGMEFRVAYALKLVGNWDITTINDTMLTVTYREEALPGIGVENRVGFQGIPYWRNNFTLGFSNRTHSVQAVLKSIGEQNASGSEQVPGTSGKTRDHHEVDLNYSWHIASINGTLGGGVKNIFGTERPWQLEYGTSGGGYLNADLYDPFGRTFYLSYTQEF